MYKRWHVFQQASMRGTIGNSIWECAEDIKDNRRLVYTKVRRIFNPADQSLLLFKNIVNAEMKNVQ